jgi:hypothetical protein
MSFEQWILKLSQMFEQTTPYYRNFFIKPTKKFFAFMGTVLPVLVSYIHSSVSLESDYILLNISDRKFTAHRGLL